MRYDLSDRTCLRVSAPRSVAQRTVASCPRVVEVALPTVVLLSVAHVSPVLGCEKPLPTKNALLLVVESTHSHTLPGMSNTPA